MDITKLTDESGNRYEFPVYKTVQDRSGKDVEILDRKETFTLTNLQEQRQVFVDAITAIDAKIAAINNL